MGILNLLDAQELRKKQQAAKERALAKRTEDNKRVCKDYGIKNVASGSPWEPPLYLKRQREEQVTAKCKVLQFPCATQEREAENEA